MRTPSRKAIVASLVLAIAGAAGAQAAVLGSVSVPALFAPNIVSTPDSGEAFGTLTPDGHEFYFTKHHDFARHHIMVTRLVKGEWSKPELVPISGVYNDREPRLSPDGKRLYFSSNRPLTAGDTTRRRDLDLWFSDRLPNGQWGAPRHIEGVNGDGNDFSPVVTANGTLYFVSTRAGAIGSVARPHNVWRARPVDIATGKWAAPENAGTAVNAGYETNVFVTPNDSLMLVSRDGAPDGLGGDDLYIARKVNGAWQPMRHLPAPINSKEYEYGPAISPDGHWLFFTSHRSGNGDIYRVSAGELDREQVERAALDYIEGFYEGDSTKLQRSLRPDLWKYGFFRDSTGKSPGERMTFDEALAYAGRVKARNRPVPAQWPKDVSIFEIQNLTASAKVTAWWGTDYLLLGNYEGRWMISSVLWQGPFSR